MFPLRTLCPCGSFFYHNGTKSNHSCLAVSGHFILDLFGNSIKFYLFYQKCHFLIKWASFFEFPNKSNGSQEIIPCARRLHFVLVSSGAKQTPIPLMINRKSPESEGVYIPELENKKIFFLCAFRNAKTNRPKAV